MKLGSLSFAALFLTGLAGIVVRAQTPATYDVSTIKPSHSANGGMMINWGKDQLKADNTTITFLMTSAFNVRFDQISGQPGWANDQHFDVVAKLTDIDQTTVDKLKPEQHRALIRALLVERLGLKYHEETKVAPIYELQPAKGGLKLKPPATTDDPGHPGDGTCPGCSLVGENFMRGRDMKMNQFASTLAMNLKRDVVDKTGFQGKFDVDLKWTPEVSATADSGAEAIQPPLATALEEQMGLHLVSTKGPVRTIVVDHLDKPAEN